MTLAPADQANLTQWERIQRIAWIAFFLSSLFYIPIGFILARTRFVEPPVIAGTGFLRLIFYAAAIALFIGVVLIRRRHHARVFADLASALAASQTAGMLCWVLMEAISILGLVLVILGGSLLQALPFLVAGPIGIAWARPDAARLGSQIMGRGPAPPIG